jgi:ketosteroid isomerase-like protein
MIGTKDSSQDLREQNIKLIHAFLNLLEQKDLNAWRDLWDENGQQINPYVPKGFPRILSGKNTIFHHWSGIPNAYGRISFTDRETYPTLDPDVIYTEFRGEIEVLANSKNYNNKYCYRFTFSKGKILSYVEYFDAIRLLESLDDTLSNTFSLQKEKKD